MTQDKNFFLSLVLKKTIDFRCVVVVGERLVHDVVL